MLDRSAWEEPRIFAEIQRLGAVAEDEMDRVFNRGIGMALVSDPQGVEALLGALDEAGQPSAVIGEVVEGVSGRALRVSGAGRHPELRAHLLEHSVTPGGLHAQVGPQEQLVHRLQADGVPARGHAGSWPTRCSR